MNSINKIFSITALACAFIASSCSDELSIGKIDEGIYSNIDKPTAFIKDNKSGKSENIVDLWKKDYNTSLSIGLTQTPMKGTDFEIYYDAEYLNTYNTNHNTQFELFPQELVTIAKEGKVVMAPDEKWSYNVDITIKASDVLDEDKTYVIPFGFKTSNGDIAVSSSKSHSIYLVKNHKNFSDCDKGDDMRNIVMFEVNDANPLNALEFVNEEGKLFFDYVVLFAANINFDREGNRIYIWNNPNVQFLLDNNEDYIQPLRKRGIKVLLGVLGNHDPAGVCQLSEAGAEQLAKEIASYCYAYNLDGVCFDDEYSADPDLNHPLFAPISTEAGARLMLKTKNAMPDKEVTAYLYGEFMNNDGYIGFPGVDGFEPKDFVDIVMGDYGKTAKPFGGLDAKQCTFESIELKLGKGNPGYVDLAIKGGYGFYMWFALDPVRYYSAIPDINNTCQGMYDCELKPVEYYYKKNDLKRYPYTEN